MNYLSTNTEDTCNGIGLRTVIWISGCGFHCENCQNQQAWDPNAGQPFNSTVETELLEQLSKDYISGLTLTGGDPLYESNLDDVFNLVTKVKSTYPNKTIWLYTGFLWEDIFHGDIISFTGSTTKSKRRDIVRQCDVLVDGRYVDELRDITLKWRGSSNQRVIDIQKSIQQDQVVLWCD